MTGVRGTFDPDGRRGIAPSVGAMNTVHLTDAELRIARQAMTAYLQGFGHDEADTIVAIRAVLARLDAAEAADGTPVS